MRYEDQQRIIEFGKARCFESAAIPGTKCHNFHWHQFAEVPDLQIRQYSTSLNENPTQDMKLLLDCVHSEAAPQTTRGSSIAICI